MESLRVHNIYRGPGPISGSLNGSFNPSSYQIREIQTKEVMSRSSSQKKESQPESRTRNFSYIIDNLNEILFKVIGLQCKYI